MKFTNSAKKIPSFGWMAHPDREVLIDSVVYHELGTIMPHKQVALYDDEYKNKLKLSFVMINRLNIRSY